MDSDPYALAISLGTQSPLDLLAAPTLYRFPLRPDPQNTRSTHSHVLFIQSGRPPLSTGLTLPCAWALSRRRIIRAAFTHDQGCQSGWIARFNFGSTLACSRPCSIATTAQGLLHFGLEGLVPITGSAFSKLSLKRRCSSDFLSGKGRVPMECRQEQCRTRGLREILRLSCLSVPALSRTLIDIPLREHDRRSHFSLPRPWWALEHDSSQTSERRSRRRAMEPHAYLHRFTILFLLSRSAGSRKNRATNTFTRCHTAHAVSKFSLKTWCSQAVCIERKSIRLMDTTHLNSYTFLKFVRTRMPCA